MKKLLCLLLGILLCKGLLLAQTDTTILPPTDTLAKDSIAPARDNRVNPAADSASRRPVTLQGWVKGTGDAPAFIQEILAHHPYFGFASAIRQQSGEARIRKVEGKELFFYVILLLLIIYGILQRLFPKYFSDLFRLFFRTTLKQRQIKEQLMQTPLPSLLLNGFFVISASLYLCFVLQYFGLNPIGNFWLLFLYCCAGISLVYFIKFVGLKICGWLFNMEEAAHSYIFIVFVVNKMIGILLLPFLVIIAFTTGGLYTAGLTLSWCLIGGLLLYRFILTYAAIRNQVKVNPFHFFLYLCAFEIAPLLLIYKGLLLFFRITT